jgi:hypothetical protein
MQACKTGLLQFLQKSKNRKKKKMTNRSTLRLVIPSNLPLQRYPLYFGINPFSYSSLTFHCLVVQSIFHIREAPGTATEMLFIETSPVQEKLWKDSFIFYLKQVRYSVVR